MGPGPESATARVLVIDDSPTILKVVGTILTRHGYHASLARDGVEGMQKLENGGPYHLILLDFVMPRMNGYQFCRALRAHPVHKDMPVVLMSARTAQIGDRFVEQTGAIDALGKPFDARALVAVVDGALAKREEGSRRVRRPDTMVDEAELTTEPESPAQSPELRVLGKLANQIAEAIAPEVGRLRPKEIGIRERVEQAVLRALADDVLVRLSRTIEELDAARGSGVVMRGDIDKIPLAELVQMFQLRRQTGVLRVLHGRRSMTIAIREGTVDLVQSVGTEDEFRLGRYFVERGILTREELQAILDEKGDELLGEALLARNRIDERQLLVALARQSSELIYEVLRWPRGHFTLSEEPFSVEAQKAALGLGISELVLEGFRRVDEWRLMADSIDFNAVLVVDQTTLGTLDPDRFGQSERRILDAIDGKRTVRQVMEVSELGSFDAVRFVYQLVQTRIAREKKVDKV
jgi:DNA-binding response OmpR family regulator